MYMYMFYNMKRYPNLIPIDKKFNTEACKGIFVTKMLVKNDLNMNNKGKKK